MMDDLICPACHETIGSRVAWCAACDAWWGAVKSGYCMIGGMIGRVTMRIKVDFVGFAMRNIVCPDCGEVLGGYNLKTFAGREAEIEAAGIRSHKAAGDCVPDVPQP